LWLAVFFWNFEGKINPQEFMEGVKPINVIIYEQYDKEFQFFIILMILPSINKL
jgi:hypothetical protein